YSIEYPVTVNIVGSGSVNGYTTNTTYWVPAGSTITLTATPDSSGQSGVRYTFANWTAPGWYGATLPGSYTGTSQTITLTVNNPIIETAYFSTQYYLNVQSSVPQTITWDEPVGNSWYVQAWETNSQNFPYSSTPTTIGSVFATGTFPNAYFSYGTSSYQGNTYLNMNTVAFPSSLNGLNSQSQPPYVGYTAYANFTVNQAGNYIFSIETDDEMAVYINGPGTNGWESVFGSNAWHYQGATEYQQSVYLQSGTYQIAVMWDNGGGGPGMSAFSINAPAVMGSGWYNTGAQAQVYAESTNPLITFASWSGSGSGSYSGTNNPATITMNGPITETAKWYQMVPLTFTESGAPTTNAFGQQEYWTITVNGASYTEPVPNNIVIYVPEGQTVSWSASVIVWYSGTNWRYHIHIYDAYYPNPSSGTFAANSSTTVSITYHFVSQSWRS
ncbi:MAG: hypothetical protein ACP5GS_06295, partial [Nitrososphaeria archaeon]